MAFVKKIGEPMGVDFIQVFSEHVLDTHQQTLFGETQPVQRHGLSSKRVCQGKELKKCAPQPITLPTRASQQSMG